MFLSECVLDGERWMQPETLTYSGFLSDHFVLNDKCIVGFEKRNPSYVVRENMILLGLRNATQPTWLERIWYCWVEKANPTYYSRMLVEKISKYGSGGIFISDVDCKELL